MIEVRTQNFNSSTANRPPHKDRRISVQGAFDRRHTNTLQGYYQNDSYGGRGRSYNEDRSRDRDYDRDDDDDDDD